MYVLSTGRQWRALPKDLPPGCGVATALDCIHHALYVACREQGRTRSEPDRCHHREREREGRRKRGPCIDPHGYDAGKKIKGKKRHVLVDTLGLLLHAIVHPADIQDRDGRHPAACDLVRDVSFLADTVR